MQQFQEYMESLRQSSEAALKESVEGKFQVTWKTEDYYSYDVAIRRCKMALLSEMLVGTRISESAYLCLRLAWLYEGRVYRAYKAESR